LRFERFVRFFRLKMLKNDAMDLNNCVNMAPPIQANYD
jgi:hypothetical protein